jgi:hypothetical protein
MKVQIAIIAGGLAIAAGVAYAELKPSKTSNVNVNSAATASPTSVAPQNTTPQTPQNAQSAPSKKLTNPNSRQKVEGKEKAKVDSLDLVEERTIN